MTKTAFFRDFAEFKAEIASDESERLALITRQKAMNAQGFAARAAAARAARD